jgi:translation initiation factor 2B subunit (eIF-2B alpha/beta/delta family)
MATENVNEFCNKVRLNKFGGAAEMVEDGVKSIIQDAKECQVDSREVFISLMETNLEKILAVIPSIAPMTNLLHIFMSSIDVVREKELSLEDARDEVSSTLKTYLDRQDSALGIIGHIGSQMINEGDRIATFSTSGSVMGIIKTAVEEGKSFEAVVTESRPANEGIRTMKEISAMGVPVTFGIDAILGNLIPSCAMFLVGADVITSTGEVLVKVGTYLGALVAREHNIPFYVAADTSKFDPLTLDGFPLKIRDKGPDAVYEGSLPSNVDLLNPSFELVPARLVTGYITELGLIHPGAVPTIMHEANLSDRLVEKLRDWVKNPTKM